MLEASDSAAGHSTPKRGCPDFAWTIFFIFFRTLTSALTLNRTLLEKMNGKVRTSETTQNWIGVRTASYAARLQDGR